MFAYAQLTSSFGLEQHQNSSFFVLYHFSKPVWPVISHTYRAHTILIKNPYQLQNCLTWKQLWLKSQDVIIYCVLEKNGLKMAKNLLNFSNSKVATVTWASWKMDVPRIKHRQFLNSAAAFCASAMQWQNSHSMGGG